MNCRKADEQPPKARAPRVHAASETKKADETHISDKAKKYTVQVGAFRNASDADALRSKLGKKGYKTFLIELKAKNNEPLYKVAVGSFSYKKRGRTSLREDEKVRRTENLCNIEIEQEDLR